MGEGSTAALASVMRARQPLATVTAPERSFLDGPWTSKRLATVVAWWPAAIAVERSPGQAAGNGHRSIHNGQVAGTGSRCVCLDCSAAGALAASGGARGGTGSGAWGGPGSGSGCTCETESGRGEARHSHPSQIRSRTGGGAAEPWRLSGAWGRGDVMTRDTPAGSLVAV